MFKRIALLTPVALSLFAISMTAQPKPTTQPAAATTQPGATTHPANSVTTAEGLTIITTTPGEAGAKDGDIVWVHYTGKLKDGTQFDSSHDRDEPIRFVLGHRDVIQGWDLGIKGMKVGEKRTLIIPPALGYGDKASGKIPANSELHFDVELMGIARIGG
jgi:FKBP-type peptidyl-prolyl cis-trans isomerase